MHGCGVDAPTVQNEPRSQASQCVAFRAGWCVPPSHGAHSVLRLAFANEPGLHAVGRAAPPAHAKPASHSKHSGSPSISLALANVPAVHVGASLSDAPSGQKSPASHASHAVALDAAWYEPAAQLVHTSPPSCALNVPGLHNLQSRLLLLPTLALYRPGAHASHSTLERLPLAELNLPAVQGVNARAIEPAAALGQYPPAGQLLHSVLP